MGMSHGQDTSDKNPSSWHAWERINDAEAWALLPEVASGERECSRIGKANCLQMPRTAAALLELDAAFRNDLSLDPQLRAKLRWIVANANNSEYGKAMALSDYKRVLERGRRSRTLPDLLHNGPTIEK